jgi:ribosome-binding factor A
MPLSHRAERIAEQLREEVSQIISTEIADPGVGLVTVTRVKISPDLSLARVYWTIIGNEEEQKKTQKALARAASYVRHLLSLRMSLRRSPEVQFVYDRSVAAQDRVEEILQEIKQEDAARTSSAEPESPSRPTAPDAADAPGAPGEPGLPRE